MREHHVATSVLAVPVAALAVFGSFFVWTWEVLALGVIGEVVVLRGARCESTWAFTRFYKHVGSL